MADRLTQDTVIPTTIAGVGFQVVISGGAVHLTRTDGEGSLGGMTPADARNLMALLLGAAYEIDPGGTHAGMAALIDLIRAHDALRATMAAPLPPHIPTH